MLYKYLKKNTNIHLYLFYTAVLLKSIKKVQEVAILTTSKSMEILGAVFMVQMHWKNMNIQLFTGFQIYKKDQQL